MSKEKYQNIIEKYLSGEANEEEIQAFFKSLGDEEFVKVLDRLMETDIEKRLEEGNVQKGKMFSLFKTRWQLWIGAAVFLLVSSFSLFWLLRSTSDMPVEEHFSETVYIEALPPDTEVMELTLSDGRVVNLEEEHSHKRQKESWSKDEEGTLVYANDKGRKITEEEELKYHQVKTPKGKSLRLKLSDGSEVWLNASSSIRFPEHFLANKREIYVEGEVYVKVEKDIHRPFFVHSDNQSIRVLGTEFNVEAYADAKEVKTTLIEGKVHIENEFHQLDISPGEQSVLNVLNNSFQSKKVDIEDVVAWKEGFFRFNNIDIETIMKQISRWYGVNIQFDGISDDVFVGRFPRNRELEDFILFLQKANIRADFQGDTLIIHM